MEVVWQESEVQLANTLKATEYKIGLLENIVYIYYLCNTNVFDE